MSNQTENTLYCEWCGCEINQSTHSGFIVTARRDKGYVYCDFTCKESHDKDQGITPRNRAFFNEWSNQIDATK